MSADVAALKQAYEAAGQGQVFAFYDQLTQAEQKSLIEQLSALDPPQELAKIAKESILSFEALSSGSVKEDAVIEPLPASATSSTLDDSKADQKKWYDHGLDIIKSNKLAVILLAGGQGTRLGSSAPKGCYDVGLPSHKSLFQIQAERIQRLQKLASSSSSPAVIPWYIMVSGPTRKATEEYFSKNKYFGLDQANIRFFEQGVLPCFTTDGKIILETAGKVAVAPDGNGGFYKALNKEGVLADLKKREIEHVYTYCVDNCLSKVADPTFVGWAALRGVEIGTKVVRKRDATESVGLIVSKNGKPSVIEYSEISKELSHQNDPKDETLLRFRAANIVNHYYSAQYLQSIPNWPSSSLPYHVAHKKIPNIDITTGKVDPKPSTPNGIKLEQFIFDVFPTLSYDGKTPQFAIIEVRREDEFSPLKNAPGSKSDCPETSRDDLLQQSKRWLVEAGASVSNDTIVEISPLTSYGGEGLEEFKGKTFDGPEYQL